jgi:hypothetical protein
MKIILFLIGVLIGFIVILQGVLGEKYGLLIKPYNYDELTSVDFSLIDLNYSASTHNKPPVSNEKIELFIRLPKTIRVNSTRKISVLYNEKREFLDFNNNKNNFETVYVQDEYISDDLTLRVGSSGFDIYPKEYFFIKMGLSLPFEAIWTITPKKTGKHEILFNISEILSSKSLSSKNILHVNMIEIPLPSNGVFSVEVKVVTEFGLDSDVQMALSILFSFIAFLMMYPLVIAFMSRKFKLSV